LKKKRLKLRGVPSKKRWAAIRLFAMDVDGVLTDGSIYVAADGTESKRFSVLDGLGIVRLHRLGIATAWISGRPSDATLCRATELGVPHVILGRSDKREALVELAGKLGFSSSEVCYMGDDDIDTPAIEWAGIGAAVPDALPSALAAAGYVALRKGGAGAVRDVCERILAARGAADPG
jgi:3-deoxy-D-manno-octulosonate 8-phosphate phosphatase (KDO 8-P phosphatase)